MFWFNKCTFKRVGQTGCEFALATKQSIWGLGSCMQRIDGTEDEAFEYLSLANGKKVCCSDGKDFKIKLAKGKSI